MSRVQLAHNRFEQMIHEKDRPCLSCAIKRLVAQFHVAYGYQTSDIINHITASLADVSSVACTPGYEKEAEVTILQLYQEYLKTAYENITKRQDNNPATKAPTTNDIGHA
jgi:hypothetical protein